MPTLRRAAFLVTALGLTAADWPGFLGPARDGLSPETNLRLPWLPAGPKLVWQCDLGEGYAAPAVVGTSLFTFDRHADKARCTCRDATTGAERWRYEYATAYVDQYGYDGGPRATPTVADGRVFLHGADGYLIALDAATGKELWKHDTATKYGVVQNFFGVGSSPLVEGSLLIVSVGGSPAGPKPDDFRDLTGNGTALVAFDTITGVEKWRAGDDLASYCSPIVRAIGGKRVGLSWGRADLVAFDPASGKTLARTRWRAKKLESVNASTPVVSGDRVFISDAYGDGAALFRFTGSSFEPVWSDADRGRDKRMQLHWNTPVLHAGHLYACSGQHPSNAELRCVELASGKLCWRETGLHRASMTFADGYLVTLTESGTLLLVKPDPAKFAEVARLELGRGHANLLKSPCWAAPVIAHGRLYLRGAGKQLCYDLRPAP